MDIKNGYETETALETMESCAWVVCLQSHSNKAKHVSQQKTVVPEINSGIDKNQKLSNMFKQVAIFHKTKQKHSQAQALPELNFLFSINIMILPTLRRPM